MNVELQAGIKKLILSGVRLYRATVSHALPPTCRFLPTCSAYAEEAVEIHGWRKGSILFLRRIFRCHPLGGHGWDPVPHRGAEHRIKGR